MSQSQTPISPLPTTYYLLVTSNFSLYLWVCYLVIKSCLTLLDPRNCNTPGFPVLHCLPKFVQTQTLSIESVMPSNHLTLCHPLILPSIFPSIRVFSNESTPCIRWPKYWSFSFSTSPSNEYSGLISFGFTGWISLLSKGPSRVFSNTTVQKFQFLTTQPSLWSNSHICTQLLEKP